MSRRMVLWIAFAIVHLAVGTLGFSEPNLPMGDVPLVYLPWSSNAIGGDGIVGITETWVYPALALLPMVLAHGFAWINGYTVGWAILATACNALGFGMLIGRGRSMSRTIAAWFWLGFILLLGPLGLGWPPVVVVIGSAASAAGSLRASSARRTTTSKRRSPSKI